MFFLEDCVIAKYYIPEIRDIYNTYHDKVRFIGLFPNFSSKPEEIDAFGTEHELEFELKSDYFKKVTRKFDVTITPEVVVYNATKDKVIYKGRIDNSYFKLSKRRRVITAHELRDVLSRITNGEDVPYSETQAIGCFINFNEKFPTASRRETQSK